EKRRKTLALGGRRLGSGAKQERILHLSGPDQGAGSRRCIVGHFCRLEVTDYYSLIEVFEFKHLAWPQLSIDCN
ncbi:MULTISPECIES: hypothetical protein, partial [unclassified Roseobacter]|uniref:hypothetical protein n=1 Tax=unclassified Roseobacter TaxID=196798 RepID=UPI001C0F2021